LIFVTTIENTLSDNNIYKTLKGDSTKKLMIYAHSYLGGKAKNSLMIVLIGD